MKNNRYSLLLLFLLIGALFRIIYYVQVKDSPIAIWQVWQDCDMHFFDRWGTQISKGDWLTNSYLHPYHRLHAKIAGQLTDDATERQNLWYSWFGGKRFHQEPFYPYLLGISYKIFGHHPAFIFILQMLLGLASQLLIYLIAEKQFGKRTAILASLLALGYGPFKLYEMALLRSTFLTFTNLLFVWLSIRAWEDPRYKKFFLVGICAGTCFIIKSTILIAIILWIAFLLYRFRQEWKKAFRYTGILFFGILLVFTPVATRNVLVGVPVFEMSSVGAMTFVNANAPDFHAGQGGFASIYSGHILKKTHGKLFPAVVETLRSYPSLRSYLSLLIQKFLFFWDGYEIPNNLNYYYCSYYSSLLRYFQYTFLALSALSLFGLIVALGKCSCVLTSYAVILSGIFSSVLFHNLSRFRVPIVALLIPFAAYSIIFIWEKFSEGKQAQALLSCSALAILVSLSIFFCSGFSRTIGAGEYLLGNDLSLFQIKEKIGAGDLYGALNIVQNAIATQPDFIHQISAQSYAADASIQKMALSYAKLELWCSTLYKKLGNEKQHLDHLKRYQQLKYFSKLPLAKQ